MRDSSPLIGLARIGRLELLHTLYGELLVPQAVWDEVVTSGAGTRAGHTLRGSAAFRLADEVYLRVLREAGGV